jgi:hypothetical protein
MSGMMSRRTPGGNAGQAHPASPFRSRGAGSAMLQVEDLPLAELHPT